MSLFSQLAGANNIIEWTGENRLKLKNELKKRFLADNLLDLGEVDDFLDRLEEKVGLTKFGPSGGINEKELRRTLKELAIGQGDKFTPDEVKRIEDIFFGA